MRLPTIPRGASALLLLGALLLPTGVAAQTTVVDVKDGGSTTLFQLNDDAGLLGLGTLGTGTIPAQGAGARLMWHPAKAAFRAGSVNAAQWDDANVGDYSMALGPNTTASGFHSTAMGSGTTASGDWSTALGLNTTASGITATALGLNTTASGLSATSQEFMGYAGVNTTTLRLDR